jgi:hypothetical protein
MFPRLVQFFTSLKLTAVCLGLATILVFVGTMAQVEQGLYAAQARYFRSFFVFWGPPGAGWTIPVFPGGYLIGGVMLANLLATGLDRFRRFGFASKQLGLLMVHAGLILLLLGQLMTDLLQVESHMRLGEGESKSYSESGRAVELAVIDVTDPATSRVVAVPESQLVPGREIHHPALPFALRVKEFLPNSTPQFQKPDSGSGAEGAGVSRFLRFESEPVTRRLDARNIPAAAVEVVDGATSLGTWWVSNWLTEDPLLANVTKSAGPALRTQLGQPQTWVHRQRTYQMALRPARRYQPFSLQLLKFSHDKYPGTEIPKNFSSRVRVSNAQTGEDREVLIYMNNPLRYGGVTFYQSGYDENDPRVTILQVVRNPGWLTPYVSCALVGLGLTWQFLAHLIAFLKDRRHEP